jgi:hypothetical protein
MCVCMCVCLCVCVCLSVGPAIRFLISQRIFSKFGGNILRIMTRIVGYLFIVCTQHTRVRVRAKRERYVCIRLFVNGFSPHLLEHTMTHPKW